MAAARKKEGKYTKHSFPFMYIQRCLRYSFVVFVYPGGPERVNLAEVNFDVDLLTLTG